MGTRKHNERKTQWMTRTHKGIRSAVSLLSGEVIGGPGDKAPRLPTDYLPEDSQNCPKFKQPLTGSEPVWSVNRRV